MNHSPDALISVGWAILGCGQLADAQIAPAIRQIPGACLTAVLSRDADKGSAFAAKHGAKRAYTELHALLADPDIQAVYVVTPPSLHATQACAAARAGKHVMTDKPMALTLQDARRMSETCREAGVRLGCGFMMRYNPGNVRLRTMLRDGSIGKLIHVQIQASYQLAPPANWRVDPSLSGGGSLMDMGSHALDLAREFGGEVAAVTGIVGNRIYDYPVEDTAVALLRFASGATAFIDASFSERQVPRRIEAYGTNGTVYVHNSIGRRHTAEVEAFLDGKMQSLELTPANPYLGSIGEMNRAILDGRDPDISAADGVRNMELIDAIYEGARTGKWINV